LQQVILNLVRNAVDAMSEVNGRPRDMLVRVDGDDEGRARLVVKDTGVGLEPRDAERVFDAFYTTKSDGMGIGLSLSRSIIESHGGKLWAEPNDGPGVTFSFLIPRLPAGAAVERVGGTGWSPEIGGSTAMGGQMTESRPLVSVGGGGRTGREAPRHPLWAPGAACAT